MKSLSLVWALMAALVVSPLSAQDRYLEQVRGYLELAEETITEEGFSYEGEGASWMPAGAESAVVATLRAGQYAVVGQCDDDCTDLDVWVDQLDGVSLGSDREPDSSPITTFSLSEPTRVIMTLAMVDCGTVRCYAGLRWYQREEPVGPSETGTVAVSTSTGADAGQGGTSWQESLLAQFAAIPTDNMTQVNDRMELLEANARTRFSLTLDPGRYLGVAVCDNDCGDLDMAVEDGTGVVDSDVLVDATPVVEFEVTDHTSYTFEVRMVECSTATCGYGFRLYTLR